MSIRDILLFEIVGIFLNLYVLCWRRSKKIRDRLSVEGVNPPIYYIYCKKECLLIREIDKYKYVFLMREKFIHVLQIILQTKRINLSV